MSNASAYRKVSEATRPQLLDGAVLVGKDVRRIPGYRLVRELGVGANAVVFEAEDEALGRRVAVKIWNARGVARAKDETTKIANLAHPQIVSTFQFSEVDGHPYAVMELIRGTTAKEWLRGKPSVDARVLVWTLYSKALRYIHDRGVLHGDPHLGNLLVFSDNENAYGHATPYGEERISVKLADTGTSRVWTSRRNFVRRETAVIYESARKLFSDQKVASIWLHARSFGPQATGARQGSCRLSHAANG